MGFTMGLNLVLLMAMVATNIFSLYHLSSTLQSPKSPSSPPVPDHLIHQLQTIRATINHLTRLHPNALNDTEKPKATASPDLLLFSHLSPIASACHSFPELLHQYMSYTTSKSELDLPITQLLQIAKAANSVLRLGLDIGGGTGTFAGAMKLHNVTVITTTMNLGAPYNEAVALRGLVPLHVPLQQRLPMFDGLVDLVRCGHAVNRWIPLASMEFLFYDVDRVLRGGGFLWLDHFFSKGADLDKIYAPLIRKLGYRKVKWSTASKSDKNGEVYLTALLQKPVSPT